MLASSVSAPAQESRKALISSSAAQRAPMQTLAAKRQKQAKKTFEDKENGGKLLLLDQRVQCPYLLVCENLRHP